MVEATLKDKIIDSSKITDDAAVEKEKKDDNHNKSNLNDSSSITSSISETDARSTQVDSANWNNEEVNNEGAVSRHICCWQQTESDSLSEGSNSPPVDEGATTPSKTGCFRNGKCNSRKDTY